MVKKTQAGKPSSEKKSKQKEVKDIIPSIKKKKAKLTAAQAAFNRLNQKIASLKKEIEELPEREKLIAAFCKENVDELFEKEAELVHALLRRLDTVYKTMKLSAKEKELLAELILEESEKMGELSFVKEVMEEMSEIQMTYQEIATGRSREDLEREAVQMVLEALPFMGIRPNAKMKKARNEAELKAAIFDFMESEMHKKARKEEREKEDKSKREKIEEESQRKFSKRELAQKMQEEKTLKSIREIYIELVKALHPDKEMDESARQLKEERMKQLTEAYQAKDLAALLGMQINWLEESSKHPGLETNEVLKRYNKVLGSQVERLENEYALLCSAPFPGVGGIYAVSRKYPLSQLRDQLEELYLMHCRELADFEQYVNSYNTQKGVKQNLKKFRQDLEEAERYGFDDMDDIFDFFLKQM